MMSRELKVFNARMDRLVENIIGKDLLTPEFRKECIAATNLYRRVAEYDTGLAMELMFSTFMIAYEFTRGVVKNVFPSNPS